MSPLRAQYIGLLTLRGYTQRTQESYVNAVAALGRHYGCSPDRLTDEKIRDYLLAGPQQVLSYLSRYTHRVAIGNGRLLSMDTTARTVSFGCKDYNAEAQRKVMTLGLDEFMRRFCLHILPEGFVKIRHYGLLSNRGRHERITKARTLLPASAAVVMPAAEPAAETVTDTAGPVAAKSCPHCGSQRLSLVAIYYKPQDIPVRLLPSPEPEDSS